MQLNNLTNFRLNFSSFILMIFIITLSSCERDDICIDPVTPNLIVRFYDKDNPDEFKSASGVVISINGIDDKTWTVSSDSIAIPIKIDENSTQYSLVNTDDLTDNFTLNYERQEVFVGRSCGFKMIFNNASISNRTNSWIQNIETSNNPQNITDETSAHVKIFH